MKTGDICLLKYEGKVEDKYRYCRIDATHEDEDGVVRIVTISLRRRDAREKILPYKPKEPTKIDVGVQRLVLICPVEDIDVKNSNPIDAEE